MNLKSDFCLYFETEGIHDFHFIWVEYFFAKKKSQTYSKLLKNAKSNFKVKNEKIRKRLNLGLNMGGI